VEDDYVEGLTGEEIIVDALEQMAERLRKDCNLRENDTYTNGYDGWVEAHLNLHGVNEEKVHVKVAIGQAVEDPDAIEVDAKVEIPLEPRLNVVRERSGQGIPTITKNEEGALTVKKRHYARKKAE
jgi:hypothetical protein